MLCVLKALMLDLSLNKQLYMTTYKIAHNIKTPKVCHAGLSGILLGRKIPDKPA
jgi:hypothetical protein